MVDACFESDYESSVVIQKIERIEADRQKCFDFCYFDREIAADIEETEIDSKAVKKGGQRQNHRFEAWEMPIVQQPEFGENILFYMAPRDLYNSKKGHPGKNR